MLVTENQQLNILQRLRRNRKNPTIRSLLQETRLVASQLVAPLFVIDGVDTPTPITSMPGIFRFPLHHILKEVEQLRECGIKTLALFPVIPTDKKDEVGSESLNADSIAYQAIRLIKQHFPDVCIIADVALDPFTSHGHDGHLDENGKVINDASVFHLASMACLAANAGADIIAPSDMMDGRIKEIRLTLDSQGYLDTSILSYAAKYASCFYSPFRDALSSTPKQGDKKGYQLNPANSREALLECQADIEEGADMLLVKPALPYLDILLQIRQNHSLPVGAYQVSGEYAMILAASQQGWLDADQAFYETLIAIKRAGADFIFTYAAKRMVQSKLVPIDPL